MKLSMWMLYDALREKMPAEAHIENDTCEITNVRCFIPGSELTDYFVYIGHPIQFSLKTDFISVLYHSGDYIFVDSDTSTLINFVMDLVQAVSDIEHRFLQCLSSDQPFQQITDITNEILHRPVIIMDNYFQILGISGEMEGKSWEYMKDQKASPPDFLGRFIHESHFFSYMNSHCPSVHTTPSYALWKASLRINCFYEENALCRLCISLEHADAGKGLLFFAEQIGKIIEKIPVEKVHQFLTEDVLNSSLLFEGESPIDKNDVIFRQIENRIKDAPFYFCLLINHKPVHQNSIYYWLCGRLETLFPESAAFPYKDFIILVLPDNPRMDYIFSKSLPELLEQVDFYLNVSNRCISLDLIRECYKQTILTASYGHEKKKRIFFFRDYASDLTVREITNMKNWDAWIHTGIPLLLAHDEKHGTDYLNTLFQLVEKNFVLMDTADALFIHRNSLLYRLKKMEQIMGCSLSNPQNRFYLSLSCMLYQNRK